MEQITENEQAVAEAVELPLWREHRAVLEWLRLRVSRVHRGVGVPRGGGEPVLLIPGFLCGDVHLAPLHGWLRRIGYRPYHSGIALNARCLDTHCEALIGRIREIHTETGEPVHLVGHSLGGLLARSAAALCPGSVASVVTLGSPFQQLRSHPLVLSASRALAAVYSRLPGCASECMTPACTCAAVQEATALPEETPLTAIYTREDGVVDWESCRTGAPGRDVEVGGSHLGLMYNPDAYRAIARHLQGVAPARRGAGPGRRAA